MATELQFLVIFALDFIAFALALAAEQTRSTAKVLADGDINYLYCVYDSKIATLFGTAAAITLFISQASLCFCFRKAQRPKGSRSWCGIALSIICCAIVLMAEACLIWGSVSNSHQTKHRYVFGDTANCHTLRKGVFTAGAGFIMITSLLSNMNHFYQSKTQEEFVSSQGNNGDKGEYSLMLVTSTE